MTAQLSRFEMVRALVRQGVFPERAEKLVEQVSEVHRLGLNVVRIASSERLTSEHEHQVELFAWAEENTDRWPELALMYAIPNFIGLSTRAQGGKLKAEGRKWGVPDICLPVARGEFHGLYIELKRIGGKPSEKQLEWRAELRAQGYRAEIIEGWQAARDLIVRYLDA